jgi:hypothetical protein
MMPQPAPGAVEGSILGCFLWSVFSTESHFHARPSAGSERATVA